jgi:hypothetical protein
MLPTGGVLCSIAPVRIKPAWSRVLTYQNVLHGPKCSISKQPVSAAVSKHYVVRFSMHIGL